MYIQMPFLILFLFSFVSYIFLLLMSCLFIFYLSPIYLLLFNTLCPVNVVAFIVAQKGSRFCMLLWETNRINSFCYSSVSGTENGAIIIEVRVPSPLPMS